MAPRQETRSAWPREQPALPSGAAASASSSASAMPAAKTIDIKDAAHHMDEYVTVCSQVYGSKELESMTLVNLGGAYPDQLLTLVLRGAAKDAYKTLDGRMVCVTGKLVDYKGKPEIIVRPKNGDALSK